MGRIEIVLQDILNVDNKTLLSLNKILGQSLIEIKQNISQGLPLFSKDLRYSEVFIKIV